MKTNKKNKMSGIAVGAGMAAIGAGAYYLLGPNAKAHQKRAKALLARIEKEVKSKVKKIKEVTPPIYHKTVDTISKKYAEQYKLHEKDIRMIAGKLKKEWNEVNKKAAKKHPKKSKKKST